MATSNGIRPECTSITLGVGQKAYLRIFDLEGNEIEQNRDLSFEVNDSHFVHHEKGEIEGISPGNTSITVTYQGQSKTIIRVQVIPSAQMYMFNEDLPIFMLNEDRSIFHRRGIYTCQGLLDYVNRASSREMFSLGSRAQLYAREAALFELPFMDRSFALLAAFAGVRNIYDLSRVDKEKAVSVFKIVAPMSHMFDGVTEVYEMSENCANGEFKGMEPFTMPSDEMIRAMIDRASAVTDFSSKYAKFVCFDDEPSYLFGEGIKKIKTDTDVMCEALEFLQSMSISLPLPRTISGKVVMRKKNEDTVSAEPQSGFKVTISGIANPASDKSEDDEDLHAFTDNDGDFIIVMPEKYNMQETVKFTVSCDDSKNTLVAMTSEERMRASRTTTFVKRASEILKSMCIEYFTWISLDDAAHMSFDEDTVEKMTLDQDGKGYWIFKSIPAIELLEKLDRLQEANKEAKNLEDELYKRALAAYDREQLGKQIEELTTLSASSLRDIFDELSYHLYLKEKEIDKVLAEKDKQVYGFDKNLKRYLGKKEDELGKQADEFRISIDSADEVLVAQMSADLMKVQHKIDVVKTLRVTSKKEDDDLFRYLLDKNYDYDLRAEISENATSVRREELVEYLEMDKELEPKLQDFLNNLRVYNAKLDALEEEKALLERLVKLAEAKCLENEKAQKAADSYEDAQEDQSGDIKSKKEDRLSLVEEEHAVSEGLICARETFDQALARLYADSFEDCQIYGSKYKKYVDIESQLDTKKKEYARLTEVTEVITREDIFKQYCDDHAEEKMVKDYYDYDAKANQLYHEIQDMDDTIGVHDLRDFEGTERDKDSYEDRSNGSSLQATISSILSKSLDAKLKTFELIEENFKIAMSKPRALPTVRLMGEGKEEVELPTDTAPARVFNYSIMQRLVEPAVKEGMKDAERIKIVDPIDIMDFKERLYNADTDIPIASSLGIGYVLNMHQAWIPDGFALGNLLYSMILAPGEEQRVVVREHAESYMVNDDASALDNIRDEYVNNQIDHETAAFEQAVLRASDASSDYSYSSKASSLGASVSGGWGPISASASVSTAKNSGKGSASAAQNDSYDEISTAAQDFQSSIKTQSERLSSAKRLSIRVASSKETESVSSKIVANHNHSHVMTVQYWEVTRRYKMETCIEGIDLILFVPLKPVSFLPEKKADYKTFSELTLPEEQFKALTKKIFTYRYQKFLRYADILDNYLPRRYRGGLELIKKYAALPNWTPQEVSTEKSVVQLKLVGYFLEYDNISATLHFNNSNETIIGELEASDFLTVDPSLNTRKDVIYAFKKMRQGYGVAKIYDQTKRDIYVGWYNSVTKTTTLDDYFTYKIEEVPYLIYTFYLPSYLSKDDISFVSVENNLSSYDFALSQDRQYLQEHELRAVENYEHRKLNLAADDINNEYELRSLAHFRESLPECYARQIQTFNRSELISFGGTKITAYVYKGQGSIAEKEEELKYKEIEDGVEATKTIKVVHPKVSEPFEKVATSSSKLLANPIRVDVSTHVPVLGFDDILKIEETFRHVTTNSIRYSLAVWNSLNEIERTMLLEQYTVDLDYGKIIGDIKEEQKQEDEVNIPLLNCINVKKPLGFYGNCMLFPFTYPQELAEKLGKTAGDIQDELYRYHTTNFRVPSTSISVPTNGMIGEAVLGRTNVSEKIDITRFWNWKDSEIDHIDLDQKALNGHSLLDNADTKWVDAPTQGVVATEHVNGSGLLNSLTSRQQPTFADVLSNTDIRGLLQNADNNASAGREQVVRSNADMTKSAITAAADIAKTAASKANAVANKVGDRENIKSALKKMGLSESAATSYADKIAAGDTSFSDALTAIANAGGKSLGGLSDSEEGGESGHPEGGSSSPVESQETNNSQGSETQSEDDGVFSEILNYAVNAIEAGLTPVEMYNQWMKEKTGEECSYTEDEIRQIADQYCEENGTSMDAVMEAIEELCKE